MPKNNELFEVFRDIDSARVGLYDGLLRSEGIKTLLRNWNAVSMTTEIPIPVMYPNICVFSREDCAKAKEIIDQAQSESPSDGPDWQCPACGSMNEATFAECWSCQAPFVESQAT
ncbi:MAG: DUF7577 domain-containing protein [Puniceicoccales bacterium]